MKHIAGQSALPRKAPRPFRQRRRKGLEILQNTWTRRRWRLPARSGGHPADLSRTSSAGGARLDHQIPFRPRQAFEEPTAIQSIEKTGSCTGGIRKKRISSTFSTRSGSMPGNIVRWTSDMAVLQTGSWGWWPRAWEMRAALSITSFATSSTVNSGVDHSAKAVLRAAMTEPEVS